METNVYGDGQEKERMNIIIAVDDNWKGRNRGVKEREGNPPFVDGQHSGE